MGGGWGENRYEERSIESPHREETEIWVDIDTVGERPNLVSKERKAEKAGNY